MNLTEAADLQRAGDRYAKRLGIHARRIISAMSNTPTRIRSDIHAGRTESAAVSIQHVINAWNDVDHAVAAIREWESAREEIDRLAQAHAAIARCVAIAMGYDLDDNDDETARSVEQHDESIAARDDLA